MTLPLSDSAKPSAASMLGQTQLAALGRLGQKLKALPSRLDVCALLVNELTKLAGLEDCVVYVRSGSLLIQTAAFGPKSVAAGDLVQGVALPLGGGVAGIAAVGRAPVYIPDVRKSANYINNVFPGRSEYAVPLIHAGELVGVIDSESRELDGFDPARRLLLRAAGVVAAPIIARHRKQPPPASTEALRDVVAEFAGLPSFSADNLAASMAFLVERTASALQVSSATLWLDQGDEYRLIAQSGPSRSEPKNATSLPTEALDWYIRRGLDHQVLIAADPLVDSRLAELEQLYSFAKPKLPSKTPQRSSKKPQALTSAIHAPVRSAGELLGMLCIDVYDGPRRWSDDEVAFVTSMANSASLGLVATRKSKAEAALIHTQRLDSLGRLAGGVAHDFNNLLTVINGGVSLMLDGVDGLTDEHQQLLKMIEQAGNRAQKLTGSLLAFGKRQRLSMQVLDARDLLRQATELSSGVLREDIQVTLSLGNAPCWIECDRDQIDQTLLNLLINAVDAMPLGGNLRLSVARADDMVRIRVEDSGAGVSEALRHRVFEPFFSTKGELGTGLGLSVGYGIIQQHGGELRLRAEVSPDYPGAAFEILLPAQTAPAFPTGDIRVSEPNARERVSERVLLVEDERDVQIVVEGMLKRLGYEVVVAKDGGDALRLLRERSVSLLITDVVMPDVRGPELYTMALREQSDLKVLFMSGYSESSLVDLPEYEANVRYLGKPFTLQALESELYAMLDRESARSTVVVDRLPIEP